MTTSDNKRTVLYDLHKEAKAKLIPFGGWEMPVQYEGVIAEHKTVREQCGIFDVSHMGEVRIKGPDATKCVQHLTINDVERLTDGNGQYSAILNPSGGMIDDLIVYRLKADDYLICVNASNTDKDYRWMKEQAARFNVTVTDESSQWSQIAVQGPTSVDALLAIVPAESHAVVKGLDYMQIAACQLFGQPAFVARTGYTGEHGYEIYMPNAVAADCWRGLMATTAKTGLKPIGLGARDTLRLEACYLLYGNDMDESVTPLEAGIGWATRLDGDDFIGRAALLKQKEAGAPRKMVAFMMEDKGIARHGMTVLVGDKEVGTVTSGSFLPTLDQSGGLALVDSAAVKIGDTVEIDVRGKRKLAKLVKRPLYSARVK